MSADRARFISASYVAGPLAGAPGMTVGELAATLDAVDPAIDPAVDTDACLLARTRESGVMLTFDEIRDLIADYEYHDGWTFEPYIDPWEGAALRIRTVQPDSLGSGPIELVIETFVPPLADAEALDAWLLWRLCRIAAHETREFLARRGVRVSDPHGARSL